VTGSRAARSQRDGHLIPPARRVRHRIGQLPRPSGATRPPLATCSTSLRRSSRAPAARSFSRSASERRPASGSTLAADDTRSSGPPDNPPSLPARLRSSAASPRKRSHVVQGGRLPGGRLRRPLVVQNRRVAAHSACRLDGTAARDVPGIRRQQPGGRLAMALRRPAADGPTQLTAWGELGVLMASNRARATGRPQMQRRPSPSAERGADG
jgi:hypothetical protein